MPQNSGDTTEIRLFIEEINGRPTFECLDARSTGVGRYVLLHSPGFAQGVAAGDEIDLGSDGRFCVVRRCGNLCIQIFFHKYTDEERTELTQLIQGVGGWLDGGLDGAAGRLLIFTIPIEATFPVIEQVMDSIVRRFDIEKWMYGNVYDPADGKTPLNWWQPK